MKLLKQAFWLTTALIWISACKKEKSFEAATGGGAKEWEFKDSTLSFGGQMDTAFTQTAGSLSSIVLQGSSSDGASFTLEIFGPTLGVGTYKTPNVQFFYRKAGAVVYESIPGNTDKFTVIITKLDADGVTGTFSGEVDDVTGRTKNITEGAFTATFNNSTTTPTGGTGQLTLWAKQGCGPTGASIAVKVQGQTGTITSFQAAAPACGAPGAASFTLPAGSYSWEAICNLDTARGTVVVSSGSCAAAEVVFGATTSTNCVISNIAYYDPVTNIAQGSLTSFFNASNQVNNILFVDSVANKNIYRFTPTRSGNRLNIDAQQYFTLDANGRITDFHGFVDATDTSLPRVIVTYTFDASGYLSKAAYALEALPTTNILNITYTWTGGNLTKALVQQVGSAEKFEYDYQYDVSRQAKNFICFFPSTELFWVQSAVNFGKNSANVLTASTIKITDATGASLTENATYTNYVLDANNYVKSFSITGEGSVLPGDTKYVLSYKCF